MQIDIHVHAEVERTTGMFAGREEIEEQMAEAIENADYGQWSGDNGGEYETVEWEVEVQDPPKKPTKKERRAALVKQLAEWTGEPLEKLVADARAF